MNKKGTFGPYASPVASTGMSARNRFFCVILLTAIAIALEFWIPDYGIFIVNFVLLIIGGMLFFARRLLSKILGVIAIVVGVAAIGAQYFTFPILDIVFNNSIVILLTAEGWVHYVYIFLLLFYLFFVGTSHDRQMGQVVSSRW